MCMGERFAGVRREDIVDRFRSDGGRIMIHRREKVRQGEGKKRRKEQEERKACAAIQPAAKQVEEGRKEGYPRVKVGRTHNQCRIREHLFLRRYRRS